MAKECKDIKDFVQNKIRSKSTKSVTIYKRTDKKTKQSIVKFKARTPKYLYTFVVKGDDVKADKIRGSIPEDTPIQLKGYN